jgi:hypothetical protein
MNQKSLSHDSLPSKEKVREVLTVLSPPSQAGAERYKPLFTLPFKGRVRVGMG